MNNHSQTIDKAEGSTVETLDIEDEERRRARMHELFMKLDASSSARHISEEKQSMFNFDRRTFATEPHRDHISSSIGGVECRAYSSTAGRSIDLENIENDEHYIEMNLGLGVFEGRTASGSNSTDEEDRSSSLLSSESSEQKSESESDTDSDTSGGSDSDAAEGRGQPRLLGAVRERGENWARAPCGTRAHRCGWRGGGVGAYPRGALGGHARV
ncbi:hypothetical protein AcV7_007566 [Taiwanofungus camphoratus]|nr:hypothetical protein AcV7_007566 [Antrodia cinnamomea]